MSIFFSECAEDDLQKTFLKYPGSLLDTYSSQISLMYDEESCVEWCGNMTECRTVEYGNNACAIINKTARDVPAKKWRTKSIYNFYQKMCA